MENKNHYSDNIIGISFEKSSSWVFLSKKNIKEAAAKQVLAKESEVWMEEFDMSKEELITILNDPFCIITKYDPDQKDFDNRFSPTITVQATLKESVLGFWGIETFEDVIESSKESVSMFLEDFKLLKEYGESEISGKKSYKFDTSYTFRHENLKAPLPVEMKAVKIESTRFFIDINFHNSKKAGEESEKEFEAFINSIKID